MATAQRDPVTPFNQLENQPIQASNNDDSPSNDVNTPPMQHQQEQINPQIIEEKISELQQQSVTPAIDPKSTTNQTANPALDKLNNIISLIPVPIP